MTIDLERPRRAKGEPIESWNVRREAWCEYKRMERSGNRVMLRQHEDALAWLVEPAPAIEDSPTPPLPEALDTSLEQNPGLFGGDVIGPLEALKAKIDAVRNGGSAPSGVDDLPALTPADLLNMVEDNPPGSAAELENAVRALRGEGRRRFAELLNEELSALEQLRKVGKAGADPRREHDIQYLLGLFARLGET